MNYEPCRDLLAGLTIHPNILRVPKLTRLTDRFAKFANAALRCNLFEIQSIIDRVVRCS